MAQLFGVGVPAISKHLKNIFEENELDPKVVVSKMEITTQHGAIEGKTQKSETSFYSLDAIHDEGDDIHGDKIDEYELFGCHSRLLQFILLYLFGLELRFFNP